MRGAAGLVFVCKVCGWSVGFVWWVWVICCLCVWWCLVSCWILYGLHNMVSVGDLGVRLCRFSIRVCRLWCLVVGFLAVGVLVAVSLLLCMFGRIVGWIV